MTRKYVRTGQPTMSRGTWLEMFETVLGNVPKRNGKPIPITIRQLWYLMISHPYNYLINVKEVYNSMDGWITEFRKTGEIDWKLIEDRSRHEISGRDFESSKPDEYVGKAIKGMEKRYKKELWTTQEYYVEVWLEKDTISEIVANAALPYRVLTFPAGGQSSFTKVKEGALRIIKHPNKKKKILYLGDYDPYGHLIEHRLKRDVNLYSESKVKIEWETIGINLEQIKRLDLRPNIFKEKPEIELEKGEKPNKIVKDWEAIHGKDKWEVDALPMSEMQEVVETKILKCITDTGAWNEKIAEQKVDREEIKGLTDEIIDQFGLPISEEEEMKGEEYE